MLNAHARMWLPGVGTPILDTTVTSDARHVYKSQASVLWITDSETFQYE
jgi:hypothetical protein